MHTLLYSGHEEAVIVKTPGSNKNVDVKKILLMRDQNITTVILKLLT